MKTITILLLTAFITTLASAQQYAIKSGYIEYKLSGNTTGTKTIWWDNYGAKSRTEIEAVTRTTLFGMSSEEKTHTLNITVKEHNWTADLIQNTGTKSINPMYNEAIALSEALSETQKKELEKQIIEAFNGEKLGTENLLGKTCEILSILGGKMWIYKGVVLKSDISVMGLKNMEQAIKFQENTAIPDSKFTPLTSLDYQDLQTVQEAYYGDIYDTESDADEDEIIPVSYPFHKFQQVIDKFSYPGYTKMMCKTVDGNHMAIFTKAMFNSITVVATSDKNYDDSNQTGYESFKYKGRNCWYGNFEEDEGTAIIIEYPESNMYIVVAGTPYLDKDELLKISDKLIF